MVRLFGVGVGNGVSLGVFEPGQVWTGSVADFDVFVASAPIYGTVRADGTHVMVPEAFRGSDFAFGNSRRATLGIWIRALERDVSDCSIKSRSRVQSTGAFNSDSGTYVEIIGEQGTNQAVFLNCTADVVVGVDID